MKYKNIDCLDSRIEKIVRRKVKYYYTDWKNYDRPKYMCYKGSTRRADKKLFLLVRDCGTYLLRAADVKDRDTAAGAIYDYFRNYEKCDYYEIDIDGLEVKKHNPAA